MSNYNIMVYILDDDREMSSSFFNDLENLMKKDNNIPINIIYHSKYFFGNMKISIKGNKAFLEDIGKMKRTYANIKKEISDLYINHYDKNKKNIFIFCGHVFYLYSNQNQWKGGNIFEDLNKLELIILDTCYSSRLSILDKVFKKTKYVLSCQTTSPNYGFMSENFVKILNSKTNNIKKYKNLIDEFIKRNSSIKYPYSNFNYKTDGVLIDIVELEKITKKQIKLLKDSPKKKNCRIENSTGYNFYDIVCLLKYTDIDKKFKEEIKNVINSSVIYQKRNYLQKNKILSGISIEL